MSDRKLMGVPGGQLEDWLKDNLEKSKGNYVRWGRMVLRAIDVDDGLALVDIFVHKQKQLGSDINAQATIRGYEGHIWSAWLHNHIGDTALHIALKQKRMLCVYALLLSGCDITIRNEQGKTANDLSMYLSNLPISVLQKEARVGLAPCIDPRSLCQLPDHMHMRNIEQEAWHLMDYGRCCYLELPQSAKHDLASSTSNPYALGVENKGRVKAKRKEDTPPGETLCEKVSDEHLKNSLLLQKEVKRELTSGEVAVGNVWGSNDITDVVRMLDNQMNRRRRIDRDNELRQSGLGLLSVLKGLDSAAVNATFATGKSALSGGAASIAESGEPDGLTIGSGMGDEETVQGAEQEHQGHSEEPNYKDRTPFTMDRLPAHVRESKGSMAGIARLKFLQLNQEKAASANEFAAIKFQQEQDKLLPGGKKPAKSGREMMAEAGMRADGEPVPASEPGADGQSPGSGDDNGDEELAGEKEATGADGEAENSGGAEVQADDAMVGKSSKAEAGKSSKAAKGGKSSKSVDSNSSKAKSSKLSKASTSAVPSAAADVDIAVDTDAVADADKHDGADGEVGDAAAEANSTLGTDGAPLGESVKKSVKFAGAVELAAAELVGGDSGSAPGSAGKPGSEEHSRACTPTAGDLHNGLAVEVRFHGRGKWFSAKITRCRRNGTYDIEYDDGEEESQVPIDNIRIYPPEEAEPERERVVYDESGFIKVATDIPVVKSRNIFKGLLYSTASQIPEVQLKVAAQLNSSQTMYDDGYDFTDPDVRMIQDDMGTGRSRQSTGRSRQSGDAPGGAELPAVPVLKGQIPGAIPGVTTEVLYANKVAGHNTDEYLGLVSVKEISHLSTFSNMKYMKVGDDGLIALTDVLNDDYLVRTIMLDHAHIASRGVSYFSKKLYTMSALMYLDLSQNAIDDTGAINLAQGLEKCMFVSYSTYQRKCLTEQQDTSANSIIDGGSAVGGVSIPSFNNNSGMADGSTATQRSDYYADYSKKHPLTTLVLRANRITDVGVEALMKVVYKLNTVANCLDTTDTNSIDLYVCSTAHKTPLAKYLGDKLTREAPPLATWKSSCVNGFGLKRPEKKFYPRNPLKKVAPVSDGAGSIVPALVPLSSDKVTANDSCFITNTSKIKAALLPSISSAHGSRHGGLDAHRPAPASTHVVQFYLNITLNPVTNACKERHFKTCNAKNNNKTFHRPHKQPQPVHAASFLGVPDTVLEDGDDSEEEKDTPNIASSGANRKQRYIHCQILL